MRSHGYAPAHPLRVEPHVHDTAGWRRVTTRDAGSCTRAGQAPVTVLAPASHAVRVAQGTARLVWEGVAWSTRCFAAAVLRHATPRGGCWLATTLLIVNPRAFKVLQPWGFYLGTKSALAQSVDFIEILGASRLRDGPRGGRRAWLYH